MRRSLRTFRRVPFKDMAIAALFSIGIVWALSLVWDIAAKEERAREGVAGTKQEFAALASREATLKRDLDELATPRGQEAAMREALGVARPGEEVIIVVPPEEAPPPPPKKHWWQGWFDWF